MGGFSKSVQTPIEACSPVKLLSRTKNRTLGHMLSNNGLCLHAAAQYVLLPYG